jgi:Uma2 family endonuclease
MAIASGVPVEEYLATAYRPDCDYVDGEVQEREVGEQEHSRLQGLLMVYLGTRETQWQIRAFPEQRVQVRPSRFRVPDLCVTRAPHPVEAIFITPPFLCVEILSARDTSIAFRNASTITWLSVSPTCGF